MEPRIAGSVSKETDTQESPQGTGLVTAGTSTFPGPILFTRHRFYHHYTSKRRSYLTIIPVWYCLFVETIFALID